MSNKEEFKAKRKMKLIKNIKMYKIKSNDENNKDKFK